MVESIGLIKGRLPRGLVWLIGVSLFGGGGVFELGLLDRLGLGVGTGSGVGVGVGVGLSLGLLLGLVLGLVEVGLGLVLLGVVLVEVLAVKGHGVWLLRGVAGGLEVLGFGEVVARGIG